MSLPYAFSLLVAQMVDSAAPTTRAFWRKEYYAATDAEANDPRPFEQVLADRIKRDQAGPAGADG